MRHGSPERVRVRGATRWLPAGAIVVAALSVAALLDACGSSSSTAANVAVARTCKEVEAVLSDGPEAAADPVGYAQAQVLPLHQIRTSDRTLREAIDRLASAYQAVYVDGRMEPSAKRAVSSASAGLDRVCPGAAA
jgi:hypothetical protein